MPYWQPLASDRKGLVVDMDRKAQGTLVMGLLGVFIFAIIATAILPTLGDQIASTTGDGNAAATNLSGTDTTILQLWPTFIIIGGLLAILASVGLT